MFHATSVVKISDWGGVEELGLEVDVSLFVVQQSAPFGITDAFGRSDLRRASEIADSACLQALEGRRRSNNRVLGSAGIVGRADQEEDHTARLLSRTVDSAYHNQRERLF